MAAAAVSGCAAIHHETRAESAWWSFEPQRIVVVRGVEYDVNLRWFTGAERSLMVHRTDKQPMFEAEFEQENTLDAIQEAYGRDVCFGEPLVISSYTYERPGVWVGHGTCPGGVAPAAAAFSAAPAAPAPTAAPETAAAASPEAAVEEAAEPTPQRSLLNRLFGL